MGFLTIFINVLSIVLVALVMVYAWKKRDNTAASQLVTACFFMIIWAICSFIEMLVAGYDEKIIWRNITQIGVFYTPSACLIFSAAYTGFKPLLKKSFACLIYGIQTLSILLIFTDQWHHLMRESISLFHIENYDIVTVNSTFLSKILVSLNFVYMTAALIMLIIFAIRTNNKMKKQVVITIAGMSIAVLYAIIKVVSNERVGMNMPISGIFAITCIALFLGILKYDFMVVLPTARKEVFNIIDEGIIIASPEGEVIDANKTALRFFFTGNDSIEKNDFGSISRIIEQEYPCWHHILKQCRADKIDLTKSVDGDTAYYECNTYVIDNKRNRTIGTISLLRDITEQRINHNLLKIRAERDGLTGVYNRQTFIELTKNELGNTDHNVCLIIIDVDDFKKINDNYGHIAGDLVLKELCQCIGKNISEHALFGRLGGEEFSVFINNTDNTESQYVAETLRRNVECHAFYFDGKTLHVTISIGVASGQGLMFDQLYQKADRMLYKAKESGKNRIMS